MTETLLAGLIFFAAHMLSAVTGFGANILGLPLLALVVGLAAGKQALIAQGAVLYVYMTLRWWRHVDKTHLLRIVLVTGAGLCVGMAVWELMPPRASNVVLATFVIAVGVRGLLNLAPAYVAPEWLRRVLLFLGGVVHGSLTTGGPLLVVYCRAVLPHKSTFRATLAVMWLVLAVGLMTHWTATRTWDPATPRLVMAGLPFLAAGMVVGEFLHHRVNERAFARAVNVTLITTGLVLLWSTLR